MPTEADYKQLIVAELGSLQIVSQNIDLYWELNSAYSDDATRYLYAKRAALDLVLGQAASQVSFRALDGASVSASDLFDHWLKLRGLLDEQIGAGAASAGGGALIGELTRTAPTCPPFPNGPDANSSRYIGSAYGPLTRRRGR